MRVILSSIVFMMLFGGCQQDQLATKKLSIYFDLDSLIDQQVIGLVANESRLNKTVALDDEQEQKTLMPDSSLWQEEFAIIRDFNLNKAYYVGSYEKEALANGFRYTLQDQIEAPVSYFEVTFTNGAIERITSDYFEDKSIYQHQRVLEITFHDGLIHSYRIAGFQDMIFKDAIQYTISAEIEYP